ncbi:aldehyde dehydrogenase family protein [Spirillospora sp. CA-108201]
MLTAAPGPGHTMGAALTMALRTGEIVFIGSVPTGRRWPPPRGPAPRPSSNSGESATVVFDDTGLAAASDGALSAILSGTGQCCCGSHAAGP